MFRMNVLTLYNRASSSAAVLMCPLVLIRPQVISQ